MAQSLSLNVSNIVGGSNRAPLLVANEYHHWSQRMERYLRRLGRNVWRSIEEGPHVPVLTPLQTDGATTRLGGGQPALSCPTKADLYKMENDAIAFYEISCGVAPDNFDIIINCKSAKEIWDDLKNLYEGSEQDQDKKLTTTLNEFNNFKAQFGESLEDSFKRFNLIVTKFSNAGTIRNNHETNLQFLNGLGRHWTTAKMIVQGDRKIHSLSLYKLYGELQAQESTVLNDCSDFGGPLALVAQSPHTQTYPTSYDLPPQSYEVDSEYDDEEEFQNAIALINQKFNRLPPSFRKNQQYNRPPFNRNFQNNHFRSTKNPLPSPQSHQTQSKEVPPQSQSTDFGTSIEDKSDIIICHKCNKENHFAKDCKANIVKDRAFYLRMAQELEDKEKGNAYVA